MGLSGLVGAGASDALEELLALRMAEAEAEARRVNEAFTRQFQEKRLAEDTRQFNVGTEQRGQLAQQEADRRERERRDDNNRAGVQDMLMQRKLMDDEEARQAPKPAKLRAVTVRGPKGEPINRMVPETEAVEEYRAPDTGGGRPRVDIRSVQSRGPNGEPGTKTMVFQDGQLVEEHWEPGNPSAQERQAFGDFTTLTEAFDNVEAAFKKNSVGPVQGRYGNLAQVVPGLPEPEGFTDLKSKLAQVQNSLLYLRSGKAISEPEFRRMMKELPSETDKDENFLTKLANARTLMREYIDNRKAAAGVGGPVPSHDAPGAAATPSPFKVGERRTKNGETREWNGRAWVLVQ